MKTSEFVEHSALTPLLPHVKSYLLKGLSEYKAGGSEFPASSIERYAALVLEKVGELDNSISSIRLALNFILDLDPAPNATSEIYRYHYENFIFRSVGIIDRTHRLVGASLAFDAKKYECTNGIKYIQGCVEHDHPPISAALLAVTNAVNLNKSPRNELIHSAAFSSRELSLFSGAEAFGLDTLSDIDPKKLMREHFAENGAEIAKTLAEVILAIHALLESLAKIYETASSTHPA